MGHEIRPEVLVAIRMFVLEVMSSQKV